MKKTTKSSSIRCMMSGPGSTTRTDVLVGEHVGLIDGLHIVLVNPSVDQPTYLQFTAQSFKRLMDACWDHLVQEERRSEAEDEADQVAWDAALDHERLAWLDGYDEDRLNLRDWLQPDGHVMSTNEMTQEEREKIGGFADWVKSVGPGQHA